MNDVPRRKLCEIIKGYGVSVCFDSTRCEGLLRDFCGQYDKEIFVLLGAVRQRVPLDLLYYKKEVLTGLIMAQLSDRLASSLSFNRYAARWAVESWALALRVVGVLHLEVPPTNEDFPSRSNTHGVEKRSRVKGCNAKTHLKSERRGKSTLRIMGLMFLMFYLGFVVGFTFSTVRFSIVHCREINWGVAEAFWETIIQRGGLF